MKLIKKIFFLAVFGLLTVFIVPNIIYAKETPLGQISGIGAFTPKNASDTSVDPYATQIESVFSLVVGFITILAGIWFLVSFLVGGLSWAGSGGNKENLEKAKKQMTNGVIGLAIVVASYSIIYIVGKILGLDILNLANLIKKIGPQ